MSQQGGLPYAARLQVQERRYGCSGQLIHPYREPSDSKALALTESLRPDIWLDAHTPTFRSESKRGRTAPPAYLRGPRHAVLPSNINPSKPTGEEDRPATTCRGDGPWPASSCPQAGVRVTGSFPSSWADLHRPTPLPRNGHAECSSGLGRISRAHGPLSPPSNRRCCGLSVCRARAGVPRTHSGPIPDRTHLMSAGGRARTPSRRLVTDGA
jgi:hypothetical protein